MMETTAAGMGLMMTIVAIAVDGLMLEATFFVLSRALRVQLLAEAIEPSANQFDLGEENGRCVELDRTGPENPGEPGKKTCSKEYDYEYEP